MDPSQLPSGDPDLRFGPWCLWVLPSIKEDAPDAWVEAFAALFKTCADQVQARWPLGEGVTAHVMLGGEQENLDWNVDEDALGFQALCTHVSDEQGDYLDVAHDHRCYVNVGNHARALQANGDWDVAAALMTLPHEMAHVAIFAHASAGRTPLQVFDEDGGEIGLTGLMARIEEASVQDDLASHGPHEDEVESFAMTVLDRYKTQPGVDLASLQPPPTPAPVRKRWFQR